METKSRSVLREIIKPTIGKILLLLAPVVGVVIWQFVDAEILDIAIELLVVPFNIILEPFLGSMSTFGDISAPLISGIYLYIGIGIADILLRTDSPKKFIFRVAIIIFLFYLVYLAAEIVSSIFFIETL